MLKVKFNLTENRAAYTQVLNLSTLDDLAKTLASGQWLCLPERRGGKLIYLNPAHVITIKAMPAEVQDNELDS